MSFFESGNNYQKFPNGMVLQWGIAVAGSSTSTGIKTLFPYQFPTGVIAIATGQREPAFTPTKIPHAVGFADMSRLGFTAKSAAGADDTFDYIAIGY
ncbi:gp53-like domain-containing protein [Xenorhabdus thailandensis]|uniref:gp53-like domain-containing protein n=1 Tax=Xenorhabdus thailandensis TaxID=3136255 RepID=UPI003BF5752A